MAHNKIIVVTIHQPSSKIFQMFHKAILLDKGGRLVFFGTPSDMLRYFAEAEHQHQFGADLGACASCGTTRPEFIFDVLETPLRDLSGDIIYEENNRGQLMPARRYSPEFWRDKYEAFRLIQDVKQVPLRRDPVAPLPPAPPQKVRERIRWHDEWTQLRTLLRRAFMSKLRNRANLIITIGVAPLLALLIATILRYSDSGRYDFASAYHIPTFLFLTLIVAMFLGLTNSADDIIRDRAVLQRERNLNVRLTYYVFAKTISLGVFALVQCILFVLIGNYLLEIRGMFWPDLAIVFMTAMSGVSLGLVISSLVADPKTAANIVPLVLIPQIIMGGAMIKYEDMNRNLGLVYTFSRWFHEHPNNDETRKMDSRLQVPFICEFVAMRWSYEELVVAQAKLNPLTKRQDDAQEQIDAIVARHESRPRRSEAARRVKGNPRGSFRSGSAKAARAQAIPGHHRSRFERKNVLRSRGFQERERPDYGRTTLRKPENLRLDRQRRNGTKRLPPRRQAERVFWRRKTLFRRRQPRRGKRCIPDRERLHLQHHGADRIEPPFTLAAPLDLAPPTGSAKKLGHDRCRTTASVVHSAQSEAGEAPARQFL